MKKIIIFLGLLLPLSLIVNTTSIAYASKPGINQGSGNGEDNPDWEWNNIDPETEEI